MVLPTGVTLGIGKHYKVVTVDLATARTDVELYEAFAGDFIAVTKMDGTLGVKLEHASDPTIDLDTLRFINAKNYPFTKLYLTNSAQAGKTATFYFGFQDKIKLEPTRAGEIKLRGATKIDKTFTAKAAGADWFAANKTPLTVPCIHRITIVINTGDENFYIHRDDSGYSRTDDRIDLNDGTDLGNKKGKTFDFHIIDAEVSYNLRHEGDDISASIEVIEIENITG